MADHRSEYAANVSLADKSSARKPDAWKAPARNATRFRNRPAAKISLAATIIGALRALFS